MWSWTTTSKSTSGRTADSKIKKTMRASKTDSLWLHDHAQKFAATPKGSCRINNVRSSLEDAEPLQITTSRKLVEQKKQQGAARSEAAGCLTKQNRSFRRIKASALRNSRDLVESDGVSLKLMWFFCRANMILNSVIVAEEKHLPLIITDEGDKGIRGAWTIRRHSRVWTWIRSSKVKFRLRYGITRLSGKKKNIAIWIITILLLLLQEMYLQGYNFI
ncbi:dynein light chain type 1 family protein [Striga asiatica]|uniref:Dynein light chain type 1 family protein n=1 Tax=Striga asiatica TaxID=4170 RepID=A0A5A7PMV2_STRAF|nr:dynein light chain type 1 family protein [Striga asiatica]